MPPKRRKRSRQRGPRETRVARHSNGITAFLALLGPGLITGAADDDPSGIGTYSINGAALGYVQLWVAFFSIPLMIVVQAMVSRIGLVTGEGLSGTLKRHYPRWVLYVVVAALLVSNTITAGADIGAIGEAVHLLADPIPSKVVLLPVAIAIVLVLALGGYELIRNIFKWLTLVLFAYVGAGILAGPDVGQVLRGTFLPAPRFDGQYISNLVAILGATVSPYMMFWQAREEVEEEMELGRKSRKQREGTSGRELKLSMVDIATGMVVSQVITYFVQVSTAATLNKAGQTDVDSAATAAQALRPLAGEGATILFAIGLIASGVLAVPILAASAAQAVARVFDWPSGLNLAWDKARAFYGVIAGALLVSLGINFVGINPFQALFLSSLIFGMLTPPLILLVLLVVNNSSIMGHETAGRWMNGFGAIALLSTAAAAVGLVLTGGK